MKNKNTKYLTLILQIIISMFFIFVVIYSFSKTYNSSNSTMLNVFVYLPILIQEIAYLFMAYQLQQLPEMNKEIDNRLLHIILLLLSLDGIVILPLSHQFGLFYILSPIVIGKIHMFCSIASVLLLLLGGLHSNEVGSKKYKLNAVFAFVLSLVIVYFQPGQSPTINEPYLAINPSTGFVTLLIIISVLAIISYFPSYWKDRSYHNLIRIISFSVLIFSTTCLRNYYTLPLPVTIIALVLLLTSITMYVINIKSYTI